MNTIKVKGEDVDYTIINLDNVTHIDIVRQGVPYFVLFRMTDGRQIGTTMGLLGVQALEKLMTPKEMF